MPQPIDLQTELARMTAAERIQQVADRVSLAAMQRGAVDTEEERVLRETQVRQTEQKSDEVNEETRRRNPFAGRRHGRGDHGDVAEENRAASETTEVHILDIRI